jgi:hypothetical protein
MRDVDGRTVRVLHRVKGRPVLERRAAGLLRAVHRFARARATSGADREWAARCIDRLTELVQGEGR